jgi:hypothetical protein
MQALGRKDQLRVALRIGLPALTFPCRFADALAGTSELRHEQRRIMTREGSLLSVRSSPLAGTLTFRLISKSTPSS